MTTRPKQFWPSFICSWLRRPRPATSGAGSGSAPSSSGSRARRIAPTWASRWCATRRRWRPATPMSSVPVAASQVPLATLCTSGPLAGP